MKIWFCRVHQKFGYNQLPLSCKKKKYCIFGRVKQKIDEKGQTKLF